VADIACHVIGCHWFQKRGLAIRWMTWRALSAAAKALPLDTWCWPSDDEASTIHFDGTRCCRRRLLRAAPDPQVAPTAGAGHIVAMLMLPAALNLSSSAGVSRPSLALLKVPWHN